MAKGIEVKAVILPSAAYGLPVTSDQDKYRPFRRLSVRYAGTRRGPKSGGFSSADILRILGLDTDAGKN
jgi:hypothetical protein